MLDLRTPSSSSALPSAPWGGLGGGSMSSFLYTYGEPWNQLSNDCCVSSPHACRWASVISLSTTAGVRRRLWIFFATLSSCSRLSSTLNLMTRRSFEDCILDLRLYGSNLGFLERPPIRVTEVVKARQSHRNSSSDLFLNAITSTGRNGAGDTFRLSRRSLVTASASLLPMKDFPVPGGPWTRSTLCVDRARSASSCDGSNFVSMHMMSNRFIYSYPSRRYL
mmetsp:Transcript_150124/g.262205  ORF Transcript_150124/g.262205 Transcript_150124/m.262205 type:complete len:222 (+) Transcript_150124:1141-1806(+)